MKVGRNDACPCGSGLKYKKCCLVRESAMLGAYSSGDREDALGRLDRFCERSEAEGEREAAEEEFFAPVDRLTDVDTRDQDVLDAGEDMFEDWFAFDRRGEGGLTPVEHLLQDQGEGLTDGEREYLERLGRTELRLFEVTRLTPHGLDLVDLLTNEPCSVGTSDGSDELEVGDLLAARLMAGPAGTPIIEGSSLLYPSSSKDAVLGALRRMQEEVALGLRDDAGAVQSAAPVLHLLWVMHTAPPLAPEVCIHVVFDVLDRALLMGVLAAHEDIEEDEDEDTYLWVDRSGDEEEEDLGAFTLEDDRLIFHAADDDLAERARRMIERAAGGCIRYVDTYPEAIDDDEEEDDADPPR
jgi:hypothetical protein